MGYEAGFWKKRKIRMKRLIHIHIKGFTHILDHPKSEDILLSWLGLKVQAPIFIYVIIYGDAQNVSCVLELCVVEENYRTY